MVVDDTIAQALNRVADAIEENGGKQPFIFLLTKTGQPGMMLQPAIAGRKRR